ncbi:MAG TPA: hypothetical protein VG673_15450, partial [Actinomycetota bacterium]|nr:hypothetical protein [Actinomycetota bacterium]
EQREWWRDASQHLARVVSHDAPTVHIYRDGGAGEAGFVQIIQGHSDAPAPMADASPRSLRRWQTSRPSSSCAT